MPKFGFVVSTNWCALLGLMLLSVAVGFSGCGKDVGRGAAQKHEEMSAIEVDNLFSHLDRKTLVVNCGEGEGNPDPAALHYNFGFFIFAETGAVLTTANVIAPDETVGWTNVHRESTNELLSQMTVTQQKSQRRWRG